MFGWLIEHVIFSIPEYVWIFLIAGSIIFNIISSFIAKIPGFSMYALTVKLVSICAFTIGVFMVGGVGTSLIYQQQIKEMESKIAQAVEESNQANDELQKKIDRKNKKIKEIKDASKALIKSNRVEIDRDCSVPDVAIRLHNNSASQNAISKDSRRP